MDAAKRRGSRRRLWTELCQDDELRGRWVALEQARYDGPTPIDGEVVDFDDDLGNLCARVQNADYGPCAILFCDDKASGIRRAPATG